MSRRPHAPKLPPMDTAVMVTTAGGHSFLARQIKNQWGRGWLWEAVQDQSSKPPECWEDNLCWPPSDDYASSDPVCEWREI